MIAKDLRVSRTYERNLCYVRLYKFFDLMDLLYISRD